MDMATVLTALEIMWKGMLGIFVTILIIMICVFIMSKREEQRRGFCAVSCREALSPFFL